MSNTGRLCAVVVHPGPGGAPAGIRRRPFSVTQQTGQHTLEPGQAPTPPPSADAVDEIFLTPRVIDRKSFEQYAASLRRSLEETTRESDLLARRAEAAAVVLERLERFVGSHSDVFDRASQLIESIDERQDSTSQLLDRITRQTESANQAVREIETLVRERGEAFEQRLITLATAALDRFEKTRDELSKNAATMRRDLTDRLDQIRDRGEAVVGTLEDRATGAGETLATLLEEVDTQRELIRTDARDASRKLDEKASELRDAIVSEGSGIKRELDTATRSLREAIAAGSAHRDTIERAAELAVSRAQSGVSEQTIELDRLARGAEKLVRDHRETIEGLEAELRARSLSAHEMIDTSIRQKLTEAQREAEMLCAKLRDAVEEASQILNAEELEVTIRRIESAQGELKASISAMEVSSERAITDSEEARQSLIRASEDIRGRSTQLIEKALDAVESSRPTLDQITGACQRAESLVQGLDERGATLDTRITDQVNIVMQERTLAMVEQIGILEDRLERSEAREDVLRRVVESQTSDIGALREQMHKLEQRLAVSERPVPIETQPEPKSETELESEPEPLIPVVRTKTPTRKKTSTKEASKTKTSKTTTKKPTTKKPATRKTTTKKSASRSTSKKKTTSKKSTTRKASTKKSDEVEKTEEASKAVA